MIFNPALAAERSDVEKKELLNAEEQDLPEWFRDSQRLSQLLGGKAVGDVSDAKVIQRLPTPIDGLDALVIEGIVADGEREPHPQTFVIYVDKGDRYLVAGLLIDMETNRNLGQLIDQQVRGERADNPALALNPTRMHAIYTDPARSEDDSLIMVVDLGPERGRRNLFNVATLRKNLKASGQSVRSLRIVPVSAGQDELSTAAMAMALGFDQLKGDGFDKLIEYAAQGRQAPWLDKKKLREDPQLKEVMGLGIFKLDENSTQALLSRINTLPVIYEIKENKVHYIPTPTSDEDWKQLLKLQEKNQ